MAIWAAVLAAGLAMAPAVPAPFVDKIAGEGSADCARAAKVVLLETGGQLLSVRSHPNRCTIVFLVFQKGQRPQKKIVSVFTGTGALTVPIDIQQKISDDYQSL